MFYRSILHHRQFRYLGAFYLHSIVRLFAVSIFQIFSSIYIYQSLRGYGTETPQALALTSLFFALTFLVHALSIAPSLWLINKKGLRFSVFWGNIFLIGFFLLLYLGKFDPIFFIIAAVLGGLQIGLYWTAYHIYFAELSDDSKQGEEIGISVSLSAIASIGGPAFGGLLIGYAGFGATFLVMTILIGLAVLPLKYLPKQKDIISIDILQTVLALAPKKEARSYFALFGFAVIDLVGGNFWPLFVFPALAGFIGVGFMGSLVALVATVTTITTGFVIDRLGVKKVLTVLSSLDSLTWIIKPFVVTPLHIFSVAGISAFTTAGQMMSVDTLVYERARHENLVAYIVQREVGLALSKFIFLLLMGILFWFGLPLVFIFVMAALAALGTRLYPEEPLATIK